MYISLPEAGHVGVQEIGIRTVMSQYYQSTRRACDSPPTTCCVECAFHSLYTV
ncbi:hypothetical protein L210DRAFT_3546344 [Boletus edulis BED1]|uniref:Uncharacterized protein n=1 Tax=Boletus edulis BED1 TaxID=1328754 RepID=A0AAD4GCL5_BOLED|nr:hypothetical protein L210DRAFT_3591965 [Boletus edulis BED1]KAF8437595.1 hypothetical protein L210DRAFT_3546344 [Boletus edulis BED1]